MNEFLYDLLSRPGLLFLSLGAVVSALLWCGVSLSRRAKDLEKKEKSLSQRTLFLSQKEKDLSVKQETQRQELARRERELSRQEQELVERQRSFCDAVRRKVIDMAQIVSRRPYLRETPAFRALQLSADAEVKEAHYDRLSRALHSSIRISSPFDLSASVSLGGETYHTTLHSCTCPDFQGRHQPCKHMLKLAIEVGFLLQYDTIPLQTEICSLLDQRKPLEEERRKVQEEREALSRQKKEFSHLVNEQKQTYPWMAKMVSEFFFRFDEEAVSSLLNRPRPAKKAAETVREISRELRDCRCHVKQMDYQLHFYESLFPWLETFKEVPPVEAFHAVQVTDQLPQEQQDSLFRYLSPQEYTSLSSAEKSQLALDRYRQGRKANWEVGIDYERYVGYLCEQKGYLVKYNGAVAHMEDMGRDLLLFRGKKVVLVQCKRWSCQKTIHENHIFQLAGSLFEYEYHHPEQEVVGAFVTSTKLSPVARLCADRLGLPVFENFPFSDDYPCIKCHVSKGPQGQVQKIYHLPMDLQYDRIRMDSPGCQYVKTAQEAEHSGFRRAYRWHGTNGGKGAPS